MTIRRAPRDTVTQRLASALLALVLSAWMLTSHAATGTDARSDPSMEIPPLSLSAGREIPVQVIDHGTAGLVDPESLPLDDAAAESSADAVETPGKARVEMMLRRIFDETRAREPRLQQPREDEDFNAPLAVEKAEPMESHPGVLETDPAEATAEFPGFGAGELLRYRQQMYRTDI